MSQDFRELLLAFNDENVEYLIVGAHALAVYGYVRATKDLDVWVRPEQANAKKVVASLLSFGAPLSNLTEIDVSREDMVFQIGITPLRIDLLTSIDGVSFTEAWDSRVEGLYGSEPVSFIGYDALVKNKTASARPQDLADLEILRRLRK